MDLSIDNKEFTNWDPSFPYFSKLRAPDLLRSPSFPLAHRLLSD